MALNTEVGNLNKLIHQQLSPNEHLEMKWIINDGTLKLSQLC